MIKLHNYKEVIEAIDIMIAEYPKWHIDMPEYMQGFVDANKETKTKLSKSDNMVDIFNKLYKLFMIEVSRFNREYCEINSGRWDALHEITTLVFRSIKKNIRETLVYNDDYISYDTDTFIYDEIMAER